MLLSYCDSTDKSFACHYLVNVGRNQVSEIAKFCIEIALKLTYEHSEFKKFSEVYTPGPH
jgi:hypothetical protein